MNSNTTNLFQWDPFQGLFFFFSFSFSFSFCFSFSFSFSFSTNLFLNPLPFLFSFFFSFFLFRIVRLEDESKYELYGSSDISLGRLLRDRRFDTAMIAFLKCLKVFIFYFFLRNIGNYYFFFCYFVDNFNSIRLFMMRMGEISDFFFFYYYYFFFFFQKEICDYVNEQDPAFEVPYPIEKEKVSFFASFFISFHFIFINLFFSFFFFLFLSKGW